MSQFAGGAVLAFDTSGDPASACLALPGMPPLLRVAEPGARAGEALHGMLASLLDEAGLEASELALVAVVRGPGSFTGLRVGLAAAAGLRLAAGIRAAGYETTRVIAQASGRRGEMLVVLDGGQGRHFVGRHRRGAGAAEALEGPLDLTPAEVLHRLASFDGASSWRGPDSVDGRAFLAAGCEPCNGPLALAVAELASADPGDEGLEALYARLPAIRGASAT